MHDQLTYVIPTRNRPHFLGRLLHFMRATDTRAQIHVVDSSAVNERAQNKALVARSNGGGLRINYAHRDLGLVTKCRQALEEIQTPYCVFCADDDFLMPESVQRCLEFLERSLDYACAHGMMVSFNHATTRRCHVLPAFSIEHEDPVRRFRQMAATWFSTFYSVYRTPLLVRAFQVADAHLDYQCARIFLEILLLQMSVLQGKVRYIPGIHILREEHDRNEGFVVAEVIDQDRRQELYDDFRECLSEQLARFSGAMLAPSREVVDRCYRHLRAADSSRPSRPQAAWFRLRREVVRTFDRCTGLFRRDRVPVRRRLSPNESICQSHAWRLAYDLIRRFPRGMCPETLSDRSRTGLPRAALSSCAARDYAARGEDRLV